MSEYQPFALERAFDAYEFQPGLLQMSCSDGEPLLLAELLAMADDQCYQLWDSLSLSYTQVGGHPMLLNELARQDLPTGAAECQVVPIVPQEGILLSMMALCDEIRSEQGGTDFEAIVVWPSYQSLHETLRSRGVQLKHWNLKVSDAGQWGFDSGELAELIGPRTRLLVVNFPHNPSGFAPDSSEWKAIIRLCEEHELYLFSDEIYNACTRQQPVQPLAVQPAASLYHRAISMSGLSKSFGLPGLRLGWLASRSEALIARIRIMKDYSTICLPSPVEILGLIALRNSAALVARIRSIVDENLVAARGFFERHRDLFVWREPVAGTTSLVEIRDRLLEKFNGSGEEFCRDMTDKFGVFIVSASLLQFSHRYFRIGLGRRDFREVLQRLEDALVSVMAE